MDEIAELEGRIGRALDRIGAGVAAQKAASGVSGTGEGEARDGELATRLETAEAARAALETQLEEQRAAAETRLAEARAELETRLEEERIANAQLEERVEKLKERWDEKIAALEASAGEGRARLAGLDEEMQKLRQLNAELRAVNGELRAALSGEVAEPHLINKALLAELDALKAVRETEVAEIDAVLAELRPLAQEGA